MSRGHARWMLIASAAVLCGIAPAAAIVNGPIDTVHPSVGYIFGQVTDPSVCSDEIISLCSVTLISSMVAVTSGDCTHVWDNAEEYGYDLTATWVSFNANDPFDCSTAVRIDSFETHPLFDEEILDSPYNIGVVRFASAAPVAPAALPAAGSLEALGRGSQIDVSSFGPEHQGSIRTWRRRSGEAKVMSLEADFQSLHLEGAHVCVGSGAGGGAFLPSSQDLTALVIGVPMGCRNGDFLRLDTPTSRDFLDDFVTLP